MVKKMQRVQIIFRINRYYFQQKLFPNIWLAIKCSIFDYEYIMNFPIFIVYTMQQINIYSVILNIATIETLLFLVDILFFKRVLLFPREWIKLSVNGILALVRISELIPGEKNFLHLNRNSFNEGVKVYKSFSRQAVIIIYCTYFHK